MIAIGDLMHERVDLTGRAKNVIDQLRAEHGELMFHLSAGCCDGSSPMCFPAREFKVGTSDVLLGEIHECNFYISKDQFEYWKNTHITVDITVGRGSSFSLEIPLGIRFVVKSRLLTDEEISNLRPVGAC